LKAETNDNLQIICLATACFAVERRGGNTWEALSFRPLLGKKRLREKKLQKKKAPADEGVSGKWMLCADF